MFKQKEPEPLQLVMDHDFREWSGQVTNTHCSITGKPSFFYDVYKDPDGKELLVSVSSSQKIQDALRLRTCYADAPLVSALLVYGRQVHVEDRRHHAKNIEEVAGGNGAPSELGASAESSADCEAADRKVESNH